MYTAILLVLAAMLGLLNDGRRLSARALLLTGMLLILTESVLLHLTGLWPLSNYFGLVGVILTWLMVFGQHRLAGAFLHGLGIAVAFICWTLLWGMSPERTVGALALSIAIPVMAFMVRRLWSDGGPGPHSRLWLVPPGEVVRIVRSEGV